jgi:DNA primase
MADQVEEVKQKTDIVAVIGEYIQVKKAGRNYKALCPFHGEKTPSFMISPELQMYKCFGCGEAGDVYSFLQKFEGMDFGEALRTLAERAGVELESFRAGEAGEKEKLYEINSLAAKFYNYVLLNHRAGKSALNYLLKERELSPETIKTFQVGFAPDVPGVLKRFLVDKKGYQVKDLEKLGLIVSTGSGVLDKFRGRIIFPLLDHRGNIAGFTGRIMPGVNKELAKYVNSPESPIYHKSSNLFGLNLTKSEIKNQGQAIVVEGQMDTVSCFQAGVGNVVAIGGTSLTDDQVRLISRFTKKIIMALDSDFAGDSAARRGIVVAQKQGLEITVARFGKYKDPDEAVRGDFNAFQKEIKEAVGVWDFIIESVFGKGDPSSGEGKAKISREIVPILSSIPDKIVQAHYIEVVARKLGVPQSAVSEEVEADGKEGVGAKIEQIAEPKIVEKTRRQLLEERLLTMAFQSDPSVLLKEDTRRLIAIPLTNRLVEEYFAYSKKRKTFSPSAFAENLPKELVEGFAEMVLRDTEGLAEDKNKFDRELGLVLSELEKEEISLRQEKLGVTIRELEQEGEKEKLQKAIKKYDELSLRKKKLEEAGKQGIILSEA